MHKRTDARRSLHLTLVAFIAVSTAAAQQKPQLLSQAPGVQSVEFNVFLPLQNSDRLDQLLTDQQTQGSPEYHHWLTPAEFASQFGSDPAQLASVATELRAHGFSVTGSTSHSLHVTGNAATVKQAFAVNLWTARTAAGRQKLVSTTTLVLPPSLQNAGAMVTGFAAARPKQVYAHKLGLDPQNRYGRVGPYWFDDLKQAYSFPSYLALTGRGRSIAIVIDSDVSDSDLSLYFGHENLGVPNLVRIPVDGGSGPFDSNSPSLPEASLDVQQAAGMAPAATILLYNPPDLSDNSVIDAYNAIVNDNRADIVSSSFGLPEIYYTAAYNDGQDFTFLLGIYHDIFRQGNAQGITFVAAGGDSGALGAFDPTGTFLIPSIDHPASDPDVTALGGTNLVTTHNDTLKSKYVRENADPDPIDPAVSGVPNQIWGSPGGKSIIFAKPLYQYLVHTGANTRSIPDISLQMGGCVVGSIQPCAPDRSSTVVAINSEFFLLIGTSVASPDLAGLLALEEEHLNARLGNVNYQIYAESALQQLGLTAAFHQDIPGNNGVYTSPTPSGYNMVIGNGTPIGVNFILAPFTPVAGKPQSPSNP